MNIDQIKRRREYQRKYYSVYRKIHRKATNAAWSKWASHNRDKIKQHRQRYYNRLKNKVFDVLGRKCVECGFDDIRALQIDHVGGGGTKEIQARPRRTYYLFVLKEIKLYPNKYQILCANCNWIKRVINNEIN